MLQLQIFQREWQRRNDLKRHTHWTSNWVCVDKHQVDLYINKEGRGFRINCLNDAPLSEIFIDIKDFEKLWRNSLDTFAMKSYTYEQQCIMLSNWLCSVFCEWKN